jgi:hypothetical protein
MPSVFTDLSYLYSLRRFFIMSQNAHRIAAFNWIKSQSDLYEDVIPRKVLEEGFIYYNQRITLQGPQGIWKPAGMESHIFLPRNPIERPDRDRLAERYNEFMRAG